jgi:hypothetical protein
VDKREFGRSKRREANTLPERRDYDLLMSDDEARDHENLPQPRHEVHRSIEAERGLLRSEKVTSAKRR